MEIWKPVNIDLYRDSYQVSSLGRVKGLRDNHARLGKLEKILKSRPIKGYPAVNLFRFGRGKNHYIHRLVAITFLSKKRKIGLQVAHLDGNPFNNIVSNLKWVSIKENMSHKKLHLTQPLGEQCHTARFKRTDIWEIRRIYEEDGMSYKMIAARFNTSPSHIRNIIKRRCWKHI